MILGVEFLTCAGPLDSEPLSSGLAELSLWKKEKEWHASRLVVTAVIDRAFTELYR